MPLMNNLVFKAAVFAKNAHKGQFRKYGHSHHPYILHPMRVAGRVTLHTQSDMVVAASWLHDTIEDCAHVDFELLVRTFGLKVATLVEELTNPSKKSKASRATRKQMDRDHILTVSSEAKLIKLCDRIDNLNEMKDDPETPKSFIKLYIPESLLLLEVLRGTNQYLEDELEKLIDSFGI